MNDAQATAFLADVRKPLLSLHKAIIDHERSVYEKEFGPVTPAAFLQVLINSDGFRWLSPLSAVIANVDEILDDKDAGPTDRISAVEGVVALFSPLAHNNAFLPHYQPLLQHDVAILDGHRRVMTLIDGVRQG